MRLHALALASLLAPLSSFDPRTTTVQPANVAEDAACPSAARLDEARSARVLRRLASDLEGAVLVAEGSPAAGATHQDALTICWSATVSGLTEEGTILLEAAQGDDAAAARLGHLLAHAHEGAPLTQGCAGLAVAEEQERRAHALEGRLRARLGAPPLDPEHLAQVLSAYRARCSTAPPL